MADVSSLTTSGGATDPGTAWAAGKNVLGKDDFLKIFLAQLGAQDPTAPVDSQAFIAQLAQFSSLEMQQNANGYLQSLMVGQAGVQQTSVTNLVGRDVIYKSASVTLSGGVGGAIDAELAAPATNVTAVVTDGSGKVVRTMQLGAQTAGPLTVAWDGRNDAGTPLPDGTYSVAVTAADKVGASVSVTQSASGHVAGVSFEGGVPMLLVGGQKVPLPNVIQINERTTP
jgi:flagellar basal-body rod modification protein FlgD